MLEVRPSPSFLCHLWPLPSHLLLSQNIPQELSCHSFLPVLFCCFFPGPPLSPAILASVMLSISLYLKCCCSWLAVHLSITPLLTCHLPRHTLLVHSVKCYPFSASAALTALVTPGMPHVLCCLLRRLKNKDVCPIVRNLDYCSALTPVL